MRGLDGIAGDELAATTIEVIRPVWHEQKVRRKIAIAVAQWIKNLLLILANMV